MSFFSKLRMFAVLVVALIANGTRAEAQGIFLSATSSANSLLVSNSLTYTISVTNNFAFLPDAVVSNTLPATVQFVSALPSAGGSVTTNGNVVVFDLGGFNVGTSVQMTLIVQPTQGGFITNLVEFFTPNSTNANVAAVSLVTQVTNIIPAQADLGVAITVPTTAIIVDDLMTYGVSVTNAGPNAAPNVVLTNTLPPGVIFKSLLPTNQTYTVVASNLIFSLGTLKIGAFTNFSFTIQPTNAGALNFSATVGAPGILDTNTANNSASNSITIINYLPGTLVAVTNSVQIVNHQNGLIEQSILVSNVGTNDVAAVRVVVTGLTNRLFNAVGMNSGSPFVVYTAPLATPLAVNSSVTLLLQYAPRKNFTFTNSQLHAFAVPPPDLTPPVATALGTNIAYTRIVILPNGNPLIEFPSTLGRRYTMVYSDNFSFSNAMVAPPSIVAPANEVQWIDYGPPTTVSAPASSGSRFYRVFLNP
jgi:uncharacterized repeat protein (TIGR01451 family)